MKLEQIPGDYDNVDQRALELYANIHMRDFYIRNLFGYVLRDT